LFYSLKSRFYGIAVLLILTFVAGYSILAYFLHQQTKSDVLTRDAVLFEKDFNRLSKLFSQARFWEKSILLQNDPGAESQFGSTVEDMRELLSLLNQKDSSPIAKHYIDLIEKSINRYEANFNELIQLRIKQNLLHTRMETHYRSMVSGILNSGNVKLLKPLLNLNHFLTAYWSSRNAAKYKALKFVLGSIEKKVLTLKIPDIRMQGYLENLKTLLDQDYRMESQIVSIDQSLVQLNEQLRTHFEEILLESTALLRNKFKETADIREELQLIFLISALFGAAILLFILLLISRNVITPIRSMAAVMQEVKTGDICARFQQPSRKKDEVIQFGLSFNDMLNTLEANNQKLVRYQKELEDKIIEISKREKESQRLASQLQRAQKMEAIGTLAGGVAHDLNNVLSGLVSYPELLLLDLPEESPYRSPILTIQESGQKAAAIVQDLLTLARRGVAVTDIINLNDIINDYLSSPEYKELNALNAGIKISANLEADLFNMEGSPVHLSKTIMNLVSNAVESIPDKGEIRIITANQYVDHPIPGYDDVKEGDYVALRIEDSGIGISAADLERIFEPFFTKKIMGRSGTGLGMAVVWGTVKDHHGYIDVHSIEGKGTSFILYFPATRKAAACSKASSSIEKLMGNKEKVLIVDDIERQRQITADMLGKLGYAVAKASSGEEAVAYLRDHFADIVILDMIMEPGMNGLEAYRKILEQSPGQKAIIASGYSEDGQVREAQRLGAGQYIKKPFSLETLALAVKGELERD
jgi:signal transduction histidine kinase